MRNNGSSTGMAAVIGAAALALCCGGPLVIVALATTGLGATLAAFGWPALGAAAAVAVIVAGAWRLVRGRGRMLREALAGGDA